MTFSINFVNDAPDWFTEDDNKFTHPGEIVIGDFIEGIQIVNTTWNKKMYQQQWIHGIERILCDKFQNSCLVTTSYHFNYNNLVQLFVLYNVNSIVIVQQIYIPVVNAGGELRNAEKLMLQDFELEDPFSEDFDPNDPFLGEVFDPNHPYPHIPERDTEMDEDGSVSEWETTPEELEDFLRVLKEQV